MAAASSKAGGERVRIRGGTLELEGEMHVPADPGMAAVVCHPHPQYGGDMHNSVVQAVTASLVERGSAVLRFNFRGVGSSEGAHGGGTAEVEDAVAAIRFVRERTGLPAVALAGYSFGAVVALGAATQVEGVCCVAAVAPPLSMIPAPANLTVDVSTLFVLGDEDPYVDADAVEDFRARCTGATEKVILAGADHFFLAYERAVGEAVSAFVAARCTS